MVSHHEVARDTAEAGLVRAVGLLAVVLPSLALLQVLANSRDYHQPVVPIAVWLAILGAAAWLVPRLRAGRLTARETGAAMLIAVAAVATVGVTQRRGTPASVDLAILGTAWLLVLVVMSRSARVWIPGALLVFAVRGVLLIGDRGLNPMSLSQLEGAGYIMMAMLLAFAAFRPTLATQASMAARQASLAGRLAAERAAAAAIQHERRSRLAVLENEALPLLRGIADGTLDPSADGIREQCAQHAAVLRHSLAGRGPEASMLMTTLEPALRAARERGLLVTVQVIGDVGTSQPRVESAVVTAVDAVIGALPPHHVVLTVLASSDDVELYLTFGAPLRSMPDVTRFGLGLPPAARWHAAVTTTETGEGCLEVSWRKDDAT